MADNKVLPFTGNGDTTATFATDDIGGVNWQRVKVTLGADGVNDGDVAAGNPMPITATVLGATSDSAITTDTTGSLSAKLRGLVKWAFERMPSSLGSNTSANSLPVVIASDQGAVPVSNSAEASSLGATTDAEATGDGSIIAILKRLRTLLSGTLTVAAHAVTNAGTFAVQLTPPTSGGLLTFMASGSDGSSILVATAQAIKATAGQLFGYYAYNPEAAVTFVHFYNTAAASVTVGTTNPQFTIPVPAGSAANLSIPQGIEFTNTGWSCAATTAAGGNTAPATGVSLVAWYK